MVDMRLSEEEMKLEETAARSSNILLVALEKGTEGTSIDKNLLMKKYFKFRGRWLYRGDTKLFPAIIKLGPIFRATLRILLLFPMHRRSLPDYHLRFLDYASKLS